MFGRKPKLDETATLLSLDAFCREYQALPQAGGVLDQDQLLVRKLNLVLIHRQERAEKDRKQQEADAKAKRKSR